MSRDQRAGGPLLGKATKTIGSFIGAGVEAYAHNKEKKRALTEAQAQAQAQSQEQFLGHSQGGYPQSAQQSVQQSGSGQATYSHHDQEGHDGQDEEDWALDDASADLHASAQQHRRPIESASLAMPVSATRPMPCPVSLPATPTDQITRLRSCLRAHAERIQRH